MDKDRIQKLLLNAADSIQDPKVRSRTREMIMEAPSYFWKAPSSQHGRHHPKDEFCEGGLALHTLRVFRIARLIMDSNAGWKQPVKDFVSSACLLHDIRRLGPKDEGDIKFFDQHPDLAAEAVKEKWHIKSDNSIAGCIRSHMGKWGPVLPSTPAQWLVHYADNLASKLDQIMEG